MAFGVHRFELCGWDICDRFKQPAAAARPHARTVAPGCLLLNRRRRPDRPVRDRKPIYPSQPKTKVPRAFTPFSRNRPIGAYLSE
jgi:hypothetical protein